MTIDAGKMTREQRKSAIAKIAGTANPTHCYIVSMPVCGCVVGRISYHYSWRRSCAKQVADEIKNGRVVTCVLWANSHEDRYNVEGCTHGEVRGGSQQGRLI